MQKVEIYDGGGSGNTLISFISGIIGGVCSFILEIKIGLLDDVIVATVTAFLCGGAGIAAKDVYQYAKRKILKKSKHEKITKKGS